MCCCQASERYLRICVQRLCIKYMPDDDTGLSRKNIELMLMHGDAMPMHCDNNKQSEDDHDGHEHVGHEEDEDADDDLLPTKKWFT